MKKNKKHTISIVEEEVKETENVLSKPISVGMLIVIVFGLLIVLGIAQIHDYYLTATDFEMSYLNSFLAIIILLVIFSVLWLLRTEDISIPLLLLIPVSLLILLALYSSTQSSIEECSINLLDDGIVVNLTEGIGCYSMESSDIKISSSKIYEEGIKCSYDDEEGYIVKDYENNYYCKIDTYLYELN
jgi:hypothetical protein